MLKETNQLTSPLTSYGELYTITNKRWEYTRIYIKNIPDTTNYNNSKNNKSAIYYS